MIKDTSEDAFSPEWVGRNITDSAHELVVLRKILPWKAIVALLTPFYDKTAGTVGKSLRIMAALLIISRIRGLSDREVVRQVKENRYIRYFCNVPDEGLGTFLRPSSLSVFRKRLGEEGAAVIEDEVFGMLRRAGVVSGDEALIDSSVLGSNIVYPNDVRLISEAFGKTRSFAESQGIPLRWDDKEPKRLWREFGMDRKGNRAAWLAVSDGMFVPAPGIFQKKVGSPDTSERRKAANIPNLPDILGEQTLRKLAGEKHIKDRIVSLDDPDTRPIKKGKSHPDCEFATTEQFSFDGQGFMIRNFQPPTKPWGNPLDEKFSRYYLIGKG